MDKQRLLELAGIEIVEEASGTTIKRTIKIGKDKESRVTVQRFANLIRDPKSGWHAQEKDGNLEIVINVE